MDFEFRIIIRIFVLCYTLFIYNMVKHIILWRLREDLTAEEKENVKKDIKAGLEGLAGRIPGLLDIRVNVDAVADSKVRPYTCLRTCLDYEIN